MRAPFSVVIITGASSGLGASLAKAYAAPRVALGLHGRDRQRLEATARACEARGATVDTAIINVTDASAMASWLREFDGRHPVDLLIANAGTSAGPDPDSPSEGAETAARQVSVNLLGAINTIEPLLPALCARGRGRVAAVASIAAYRGLPYSPGYCASKAGLRAYAEGLRPRLEPRGIGVTHRLFGVLRLPDDRSFRRANPAPPERRRRCSDHQARHRSRSASGRLSVASRPRPAILRCRAGDYWRCDPAALPLPYTLDLSMR